MLIDEREDIGNILVSPFLRLALPTTQFFTGGMFTFDKVPLKLCFVYDKTQFMTLLIRINSFLLSHIPA